MVYVVALTHAQLGEKRALLRARQHLTKAYNSGRPIHGDSRLVLVVEIDDGGSRRLAWLGIKTHLGTAGDFDATLTIDHMRECLQKVELDGADGLLASLQGRSKNAFERACELNQVGTFGRETWDGVESELRKRYPALRPVLDWLQAMAEPVSLSSQNAAERRWQEERDAIGLAARIFDATPTAFAAWRRPESDDAPYLAGLIPEPVESSMQEHDARVGITPPSGLVRKWLGNKNFRCDIHIFEDRAGRTLEIANVNATKVEGRLGTDLIYYHAQTMSFVLVQYKRLDPHTKTVSVDDRLVRQLSKLRGVSQLSRKPETPDDWRLGGDSSFVKLAWWQLDREGFDLQRPDALVPGMYLPVSYAHLLLRNDCTLSGRTREDGTPGRILGYKQVARRLDNDQFIGLVKHGLVGTVGVTVDQLRSVVEKRIRLGFDSVLAVENSAETAAARETRLKSRDPKKKRIRPTRHLSSAVQTSLFDIEPPESVGP